MPISARLKTSSSITADSLTQGDYQRPPLSALSANPDSAEVALQRLGPRDRRAYSFPVTQVQLPIDVKKHRQARQSVNVLPPFSRKPSSIAAGSTTSLPFRSNKVHTRTSGIMKSPRSTGGGFMALDTEAVFCSTSGSSESEAVLPAKAGFTTRAAFRVHHPSRLASQANALKSQPLTKHPYLADCSAPHSPVAALVASSASSRSREDIISWARAVGARPCLGDAGEEDEEAERGRSRTRRSEALSSIDPPSEELLDVYDGGQAEAGTTPTGRLGSAFTGLGIGRFGAKPFVRALTSVTVPADPLKAHNGLKLQAVPSTPEMSHAAIVPTTAETNAETPVAFFNPGATPTLSTISFSEAMEPSIVTDNPELLDVVTDDQQSSSSHFAVRRLSTVINTRQNPSNHTRIPPPLRPIASTATAIWNLGTYLRSFAPFSIPSITTSYSPTTTAKHSDFSSRPVVPHRPEATGAAPVPTRIALPPSSHSNVSSLPLDIIAPTTENGGRVPGRTACEAYDRSRTRSESRSRRRRVSLSPSPNQDGHSDEMGHKLFNDGSDGDEEGPERGRSRRGKKLNPHMPADRIPKSISPNLSASRGREGRTVRAS